jgi:putative transposase
MAKYRSMLKLKVPTRRAASLTGVSRTTANRKPAAPRDQLPMVPLNELSAAERAEILAVLNSPGFVGLALMLVYRKLLDQGIYLGPCRLFTVEEKQPGQGTPTAGQASGPGRA